MELSDRREDDRIGRNAQLASECLKFVPGGDSLAAAPSCYSRGLDPDLAGESGFIDRFQELSERSPVGYGVHASTLGASASFVKAYPPQDRRIRHPNHPNMDLGRRIRAIRGPLSQKDLGIRAGLDITTINRIENGKIDPTIGTVERIAQALGMSLAAFFADPTPRAAADEMGSRLPEGPMARAIELLRGEVHAAMEAALEAKTAAEEAKSLVQRRARKSA